MLMAAVVAAGLLSLSVTVARAGSVELSGVHVCCPQCETLAKKILAKVDGVSEAAADKGKKTVSFTAKDEKTAVAGVKALADGGYFGAATLDGKELKVELATPKAGGAKAAEVTVKGVHVCCGQCKTALGKLFPDAKIEYGKGDDVKAFEIKIVGKDLDKATIVETLRKGGFNGTIE